MKTGTKTGTGGVWRGRMVDSDEGRQLLAKPAFRAALEKGRRSGPGPSAAALRQELGLTEEDLAAADAELDRLLAQAADADHPITHERTE
jgi:hypothetical protein